MTDETLPACDFRGNVGNRIVFCHRPETANTVVKSYCHNCRFPKIRKSLAAMPKTTNLGKCDHLGSIIGSEPCGCPASPPVDVHQCLLLKNRRGTPRKCVNDRWSKLSSDSRSGIIDCSACVTHSAKQPVMKCLHLHETPLSLKTDDGRQVFECDVHGRCTVEGDPHPYASCLTCKQKNIVRPGQPIRDFDDPLRIRDRHGEMTHSLRDMLAGRPAFLVCGGPSAKKLDLNRLTERGVFSLAVNNMAAACHPSAFLCGDPPNKFHHSIWLDPTVMKFIPIQKLSSKRGKLRKKENGKFSDLTNEHGERLTTIDMPNVWGFGRRGWLKPDESFFMEHDAAWGNHDAGVERTGEDKTVCSMLLGIRVLYYLGARQIFLVGVDMHMNPDAGEFENYAFPQSRTSGAIRNNNGQYQVVIDWLDRMTTDGVFGRFGLSMYNCNSRSALRCFPHVPFDTAVDVVKQGIPDGDQIDLKGWYEK